MTHDTPGEDGAERRWCERCELGVEPVPGEDGPACPSCGREFDADTAP